MAFTPIIIGIAGQKRSGKDTVASMINYIVNTGITKSEYYDWLSRRKIYDVQFKDNIVHFADALKDICSILFGIERRLFDDKWYKENAFYHFDNKGLCTNVYNAAGKMMPCYREITVEDINNQWTIDLIDKIREDNLIPIMKIRTMMQYVGTNICRNLIYNSIWVDITRRRMIDIVSKSKCCIIPDVRFKNEAESISKISAYKTATIKLLREACENTNHESEIIDFDCDYVVKNDNSLISLFYIIRDIVKQILETK